MTGFGAEKKKCLFVGKTEDSWKYGLIGKKIQTIYKILTKTEFGIKSDHFHFFSVAAMNCPCEERHFRGSTSFTLQFASLRYDVISDGFISGKVHTGRVWWPKRVLKTSSTVHSCFALSLGCWKMCDTVSVAFGAGATCEYCVKDWNKMAANSWLA